MGLKHARRQKGHLRKFEHNAYSKILYDCAVLPSSLSSIGKEFLRGHSLTFVQKVISSAHCRHWHYEMSSLLCGSDVGANVCKGTCPGYLFIFLTTELSSKCCFQI